VNGVIEEDQAWVGGPITLIAAGLVGLAAALRPRPTDDPAAAYVREQEPDDNGD
jgi:hypothetical protein